MGSAPVGGPWTIGGGAANFSVAGGVGVAVAPKAGRTVSALLLGAPSPGTSTDFTMAVSTDKLTDHSGTYYTFFGRRRGATLDYDSRVRVTGTGATPALQLPGAIGLSAYVSSSATNAPVTVRVRDVGARPVSP